MKKTIQNCEISEAKKKRKLSSTRHSSLKAKFGKRSKTFTQKRGNRLENEIAQRQMSERLTLSRGERERERDFIE